MSQVKIHRYRTSPDAISRRFEDEMVLIHLKTDRIFSLSQTAARLWELLVLGHTREEIERQMLEEFEVADSQLIQEIDTTLETLERESLISRYDVNQRP